jgi:hypothetical protein
MAGAECSRESIDCFNLEFATLEKLGIRAKEIWRGIEMRGSVVSFINSGLIKKEWQPGVPGYGKSMRYIIFNKNGEPIQIPSQKGKTPDYPFGGFHIHKQGKSLCVIRLWTKEESEANKAKRAAQRQAQEEQPVEALGVEKPLEALERLLKKGGTGEFNLFSVMGRRSRDGYTERASVEDEAFDVYAKSFSAKNNIFSIRSPVAPIQRIVTRYKGGFLDALLVQAYGRYDDNQRDREVLELDHVSTYY